MIPSISASKGYSDKDNLVVLSKTDDKFKWFEKYLGTTVNMKLIKKAIEQETSHLTFLREGRIIILQFIKHSDDEDIMKEYARREGFEVLEDLRRYDVSQITVADETDRELAMSYAEGMALGNYQFLKYYKDVEKRKHPLKKIKVAKASATAVSRLKIILEATAYARDLINEPLSYLTAVKLSEEIKRLGKESGFSVEVFDKKKITALKMGGLLAVNRGSFDPPTFSILEWKPARPKNKRPIVLVGKGVVYDTGGLSLKPTGHSMDFMKSDMGGSAAVIGAMYAVAKAKLPVHVITLVPATDNRPGNNAYVPGDVVTMHSGSTVEVLNTDAEGRMLLADALHFAKKYDPELVMDFATLTGAAARVVGGHGIAYMGNADKTLKEKVEASGSAVHERLMEFPMWEEYSDMLKSDIADLKNIGGSIAGATTAGFFLKHFTDYPWLHFDIAGAAFLHTPDTYRGKNGTGVGVRLLFDFLSKY